MMKPTVLFSSFVALYLFLTTSTHSSHAQESPSSDWYQRYDYYPPYCSTPDEMAKRSVPPLQDDTRYGDSRLVHVTAVIRHGARTPWGSIPCWENYQQNEETGIWNCNLTTFVSPPPPDRVKREEGHSEVPTEIDNAMFLFEKHYDVLQHPAYNLSNILNGTCQTGQLILQGYEQEVTNGRHLRQAYVYDRAQKGHDERMELLDSSSGQKPWQQLYMRSDDEQRTVMSGQLILRGLLSDELENYIRKEKKQPIVPLHTADYVRDIVAPNPAVCPRLAEIQERVQQTADYRIFNESKEVIALRNFQRNVLGMESEMGGIDCLMTTICTDRPLPAAIDDYTGGDEDSEFGMMPPTSPTDYGTNLFLRLYNFYVRQYTIIATYNDGEYSQVAMGPLWAEIMDNINAVVAEQDTIQQPSSRPTPKMAIFSGHDTTLLPLLASLGPPYDNKWPPYASMLLLEVHELNLDGRKTRTRYPTDYGFRLLYNGQSLTHLVPGCPFDTDMCDVSVLQRHVSGFATRQRDCARQHAVPQELGEVAVITSKLGVAALLMVVLTSVAVGAIGTWCWMRNGSMTQRRRRPARRKYAAAAQQQEEEDGIALSSTARAEYTDREGEDEPPRRENGDMHLSNGEEADISVMLT